MPVVKPEVQAISLLMVLQICTQPAPAVASGVASNSLAKAVLQHITKPQVPVARPIARHPAKRSADYQVPGQLDQYVTVLHVPAAPPAWMQMCRAVERQGAAAFKPWMLDKPCDLPDVQGSSEAHCQLGRRPWAHRFRQPLMAAYAAALFHSIVAGRTAAAKRLGAPPPQLSRFDLFHGHFFVTNTNISTNTNSTAGSPRKRAQLRRLQRHAQAASEHQGAGAAAPRQAGGAQHMGQLPEVGILFHAMEYPAFHADTFPIFLGNCQNSSSTYQYHPRAMDLRNILWYKGKLAVLDVGTSSPLHGLLHEGTEPLRTVYEEDFGTAVADLLLLQQPHRRRRSLRAVQQLEAQRWRRLIQSQQALAACSADTSGVYVSY